MSTKGIVHLPKGLQPEMQEINIGAIIRKYRKAEKLSRTDLAEMIDSSRNTIANWETGKNVPDYSSIQQMVQVLGIPLYELFGAQNDSLPSRQEETLLQQYRQLSDIGQRIIAKTIFAMLEEESRAHDKFLLDEFMILPLQSTPVAAGVGCQEVEIPPEPYFVRKNRKSVAADSIFRVSGDSMEPRYKKGDLLYVKQASSGDDGDDVVCVYHEGFIVKNLQGNKLYSLNKSRDFGSNHEEDDIRILGKVIGIVEEDELPDKDDSNELSYLFKRQLASFEKEHGID